LSNNSEKLKLYSQSRDNSLFSISSLLSSLMSIPILSLVFTVDFKQLITSTFSTLCFLLNFLQVPLPQSLNITSNSFYDSMSSLYSFSRISSLYYTITHTLLLCNGIIFSL
jgi:hypothetical protein